MNIEELRDHCLQKQGTTEGLPFGEDTLVFKVGSKMFLLIGIKGGNRFNVKCNPELAVELRDRYIEVQPGYHMNKQQWNTVYMDGNLTKKHLQEMIDHSYNLVFNGLSKKVQEEIKTGR